MVEVEVVVRQQDILVVPVVPVAVVFKLELVGPGIRLVPLRVKEIMVGTEHYQEV